MASRTEATVLLVLLCSVITKCEDNFNMPATAEHLLRGSNSNDYQKHDTNDWSTTTDNLIETTIGEENDIETTTVDLPVTDDNVYEEMDSTTSTTDTTEDLDPPAATVFEDLVETAESSGIRSPKQHNSEPEADQLFEPPKLNKSSTLRSWLEDRWLRSPVGILVPLRPGALNRALAVWKDLTAGGLNVSDIVVIGYDSNGVNWRSRHSLLGPNDSRYKTVTEAFSKLLLKYQGYADSGDALLQALASSAKLVPYDSALFVVTDRPAGDGSKMALALRTLLEKRLKVYTIWTDPRPASESEEDLQLLKNVSAHTEGEVLAYSMQDMELEESEGDMTSDPQWEPMEMPQGRTARVYPLDNEKMETLLVRRGGGGAVSLGVPVESGISALRVYIEGAVQHAVLYPPNDAPQINLYNRTSVKSFSPSSTTNGLSPRDVFLVLSEAEGDDDMLSVIPMEKLLEDAPEPNAGLWHLTVRCDTCDYRLTVSARARIRFDARMVDEKTLRLHVSGPVYTVRQSTLVDEYGNEISKLPFSFQPMTSSSEAPRIGESEEDITLDVPFPQTKASKVYAKIVGRDWRGEPYVRLSGPIGKHSETRSSRSASISSSIAFPDANDLELAEDVNQRLYEARLRYNDSNVLPNNRATSQVVNQLGTLLTSVQIGLSTRLYGAPGDSLQLHFEVTNYREQAVTFRFEATGELRFLRGISPLSQTIASGQTVNVIVSLTITAGTQAGARDLITFTAYGLEQVSISTYVYVINPDTVTTDIWAPTMTHNFQGTCIGKLGDDCFQHVWSASVVARDAIGGLLRISSNPVGLTYDSNFIAGTREEVVATYRATCCSPRVVVTAVDAYGNANSYTLDISNYITPAGVAAIVLGVFLAIALILLVAFLIYWCVKRRKESRELPYSTSTRS